MALDPYALPKKKKPDDPAVGAPPVEQASQTMQPASPNSAQAAPQQRAPNPTNFTNFARRFNANADVSKQQANKYAAQAQGAAGKAAGSLADAQAKFATGVNTGSVAPPPGTNAPAGTNVGAAAQTQAPPVSNANDVTGGYDTYSQTQGKTSYNPTTGNSTNQGDATSNNESTRPGQAPPDVQTSHNALESASTRPSGDPTIADMLAKAGQQYTGPDGLDTIQAAKDAEAATQQLGALKDGAGIQTLVNDSGQSGTQGSDALSGALIGSAGRQQFDALRAKFNPNKDILDAEAAAQKTADAAKKSSTDAAGAWKAQADAAQTSKDAADAKAQADASAQAGAMSAASQKALNTLPPAGQEANVMGGLTPGTPEYKQRSAELAAFQKASKWNGGDSFRDVVNATSPSQGIAQTAGVRNPLGDSYTQQYHASNGVDSGSTHGDHIPWTQATRTPTEAFWVFRQMTPDQWEELNSLPHNNQREWIQKRLQQIRAKQEGQPIPGGNNWPQSGGD